MLFNINPIEREKALSLGIRLLRSGRPRYVSKLGDMGQVTYALSVVSALSVN